MLCSSDRKRKTELISHNSLLFNESSLSFVERLFYCSQTFLDMFTFEDSPIPHKSSLLIKLSTAQELSTVLKNNLTQLNLNSPLDCLAHKHTRLRKLKVTVTSPRQNFHLSFPHANTCFQIKSRINILWAYGRRWSLSLTCAQWANPQREMPHREGMKLQHRICKI